MSVFFTGSSGKTSVATLILPFFKTSFKSLKSTTFALLKSKRHEFAFMELRSFLSIMFLFFVVMEANT